MSKDFQLQSDFLPAGDQPGAIRKLVDGLQAGEAGLTLLGVTGSGKSVGYDDPIMVVEEAGGRRFPRLVMAGAYIDELMENSLSPPVEEDGNFVVDKAGCRYFTAAYDPRKGTAGLYPIAAFLRHNAPDTMYRLTTACGREVTLTGDHNLWVLRDGELRLIQTSEARPSDCIPLPDALNTDDNLTELDILPLLEGAPLVVYPAVAVNHCEYIAGTNALARARVSQQVVSEQGISLDSFLQRLRETPAIDVHADSGIRIGARGQAHTLSARLVLTPEMLSLFGYYLAEGSSQQNEILLPRGHTLLQRRIETALTGLGISSMQGDARISSAPLAELMRRTCGGNAAAKRLPPFWLSLSRQNLGTMLRACFDGAATVERKKGEVVAVTAGKRFASDLAYALYRFGIRAEIRKLRKRGADASLPAGWHYHVVIAGEENMARFAGGIGFDHPRKLAALQQIPGRNSVSPLDRVPVNGRQLRLLREGLGLTVASLARLAGCSCRLIRAIESGESQPVRSILRTLLATLRHEAIGRACRNIGWWQCWQKLNGFTQVHWTPVSGIKEIDYPHPYVYDLSVPGPETFLAGHGGMFVHNTFTIANVIQELQRPTLILAHNKTLAAQLYGEMKEFFPHNAVEYFVSYYDYYQPEAYVPATDTFIEKDASINEHIEQMRLSATKALLERHDTITVATVSAIYGLGDPDAYLKMLMHLVRGDQIDQRDILRRLAELQYSRNDVELQRGTYRVRGEVIDIYPADSDRDAVRVELFDDEIENLSYFDPLTGEVIKRVPRLTIYPKTHYVTPRETILNAIEQIKSELQQRLEQLRNADKLVEAQRLEQRTRFDIEMMMEMGYCSGIENYSRYLSGRQPGEPPPTFMDYLPQDALLVIDESHATIPQLGAMYKGDRARKTNLVEYGFRLPSALDNRPLRFEEFERLAPQTIYVSATPGPYEKEHSGAVVEQVVRPTGLIDPEVEVRPASTQVDDLLSEIHKITANAERVLVTTLTKRMAEDLTDYLNEHGIRVRYMHSDIDTVERIEIIRDLRLGEFDVLVGINLLREGLDIPEVSLVAILDADKEGFLRSDRSLIQTIGRAARNAHGRALLYADTITASMRRAIEETERRRAKQIAYNEKHGITPQTVQKAVADIMEGAYGSAATGPREYAKVAEEAVEYLRMSPEMLVQKVKKLEQQMFKHAQDLEFEEAAKIRDEINRIQNQNMGLFSEAIVD